MDAALGAVLKDLVLAQVNEKQGKFGFTDKDEKQTKRTRQCGNRGDTPLHVACFAGPLKCAELLASAGTIETLNLTSNSDGATPIMRAAEAGHVDIARMLIQKKADINAVCKQGNTVLHWALTYSATLAEELMDLGAKPCSRGRSTCRQCDLKMKVLRRQIAARNKSCTQPSGCIADDADHVASPYVDESPKASAGSTETTKIGSSSRDKGVSVRSSRNVQPLPPKPPEPEPGKPVDGLALDKYEVALAKHVMSSDPDWIAFSANEAKWVLMSIDPDIEFAFSDAEVQRLKSDTAAWLRNAEGTLSTWICKQIVRSEKRAARFRALGRGWIFIHLSSGGSSRGFWNSGQQRFLPEHLILNVPEKRTRFKWWFEGVDRILRNRKVELDRLKMPQRELDHWTHGYIPNAELVFALKGVVPQTMTLSKMKWCADFHLQHVWANSAEIQSDLQKPILNDEELDDRARKARERKARQRRARKEKNRAAMEKRQQEEVEGGVEAARDFEDLLQALKSETIVSDDIRRVKAAAAYSDDDSDGSSVEEKVHKCAGYPS
eukprot:TRINITY_DN1328_c0_g1_i1.p1 TRINITY_DN1328_c0_g1~~TRINITY_DN1328_c0_g1_i1.p1  ORF type:complete len:550 (-),score=63.97 TRINITY_DN1328_c0_g1_i1:248-1897(-)